MRDSLPGFVLDLTDIFSICKKTRQLKPHLHKQNLPTSVKEDSAVETASTQAKPADAG